MYPPASNEAWPEHCVFNTHGDELTASGQPPPRFPTASKKTQAKDKVPPQKSITRGTKPNAKMVKNSKGNSGRLLPDNTATRGLKMRMPDPLRETKIHDRLKKKSPWFLSIEDPLHGADAKIPDETGVETGTIQVVERLSFVVNEFGVGGLKLLSPYVNSDPGPAGQVVPGRNWQIVAPTSGPVGIVWGANAGTGASFIGSAGLPFQGINELKATTSQHRIVSACLTVQPEASLASNQGEFCLFAIPFGNHEAPLYSDYLNRYKSVSVPTNSNQAGTVRWWPQVRQDWSFKSFITTTGSVQRANDDMQNAYPAWNLGCVTQGCAPGTVFRVTVAVNYEFIPTFNSLNILDVSPSPIDAQETDLVETWVQDLDVATPISTKKASSSPSTVSVNHGENDEGTGFGMFFNVISELAPLALALL